MLAAHWGQTAFRVCELQRIRTSALAKTHLGAQHREQITLTPDAAFDWARRLADAEGFVGAAFDWALANVEEPPQAHVLV